MIAQLVPYAMAAILLAAMLLEMRTGRIPNWLTLLPFVLFILLAASGADRSALAWQLGLAALVFVLGIGLFIVGGIGAGAVKLAAGLALFVPWAMGLKALGSFVGLLFLTTFLVVQIRKGFGSEQSKWYVMSHNVLPMSLPIGLTGLAVLFLF